MGCCGDAGLNQIASLDVPVQNGQLGAALDASGLVGDKTIELSGTYLGAYVVYGSHDGVRWAPLLTFNSGGGPQQLKQSMLFVVKLLAVKRLATPLTPVSISVSARAACNCDHTGASNANHFTTLATIPAGTQPGPLPAVDLWTLVSATGLDKGFNVICAGGSFEGTIGIEGSLDGVNFAPVGQATGRGDDEAAGRADGPTLRSNVPSSPRPLVLSSAFDVAIKQRVPGTSFVSPELSPIVVPDVVRYVRANLKLGTIFQDVTLTIGGRQNCDCPPLPFQDATIQWLSVASPATYLGSDNMDVASNYAVVRTLAGAIVPGGSLALLPFTVDGGAPTLGQTVWIASSNDDAGTGRSKATATLPSPVTLPDGFSSSQITIVGTVTNTTNKGTGLAPKYIVKVAATIAPTNAAPPVDTSLTFNGVQFPLGTANFSCPVATTNQVEILNNQTLVITCSIDDLSLNNSLSVLAHCFPPGAATGYQCYFPGQAVVFFFDPRGGGPDLLLSTLPGRVKVVISRFGGNFHVTMAGQNVQITADTGGDAGPLGTFLLAWAFGQTYSVVKLNRAMPDVEAESVSQSQISFAPGTNPFAPSPSLIADLTCQWYLDLTTYVGGTPHAQAGPAGTPFDFTVTGAPVVKTTTLNYKNTPAAIMLDGPLPTYGNGNISTSRATMRYGFTVATQSEFAMVSVGYNSTDSNNNDEGGITLLVNGNAVAWVNGSPDGTTHYLNAVGNMGGPLIVDPTSQWNGLVAPYHVEVLTGDKIPRIDSFTSGANIASILIPSTAVMDVPTTANLLVLTSDGATAGNHQNDGIFSCPLSKCVLTLMRNDFPGHIIGIDVMPNWSFLAMKAWGDGTVVPWARYLVAAAKRACPVGVRTYAPMMGLVDWGSNVTLATFKADYGLFIDTIHSLDPTANVILLLDPHDVLYASVNGNGDPLSAFNTQTTSLLVGRGWVVGAPDVHVPTAIDWGAGAPTFFQTPILPDGPPALKGNIKAAIHAALPTVY